MCCLRLDATVDQASRRGWSQKRRSESIEHFLRWHAASYNLHVTSSAPYRRLSLGLISLLMGLLALGPFLHAHYGPSMATGFHVNGLQAVATTSRTGTTTGSPVLSLPTDQESPAVGVVTSLPRFEADTFSADTTPVLWIRFLIQTVLQRLPSAWPWTPVAPSLQGRIFQAGFPPPAHAPPQAL